MKTSKILFLLCVFFFQFSSKASEIDSLENLLNKASENQKYELYVKLFRYQYADSKEKAEKYYNDLKKLKLTNCNKIAIQSIEIYKAKNNSEFKYVIENAPTLEELEKCDCSTSILRYIFWDVIDAYGDLFLIDEAKAYTDKAAKIGDAKKDYNVSGKCYSTMGTHYFYSGRYDESGIEFDKAIESYKKAKNNVELAGMLMNSGIIKFRSGKVEESLDYYYQAVDVFKEDKDENNLGNVYTNLAMSYDQMSVKDSIYKYYDLAINSYLKAEKWNNLANAFDNYGGYFTRIGEYDVAMEKFITSLKIREQKDSSKIESSYLNIADVYSEINDTTMQILYTEKAFDIVMKKPNLYDQNSYKAYLAGLYYSVARYDDALKFINESIQYFEENNIPHKLSEVYLTLGNIHNKMENRTDALIAYEKSKELKKQLNDINGYAGLLSNIGVIHYDNKQYSKALAYYKESYEIRKNLDAKKSLYESYQLLSNVYSKLKDYKNAYEFHVLYTDLKDSLLNEDKNRAVLELREVYESEKKDLENAKLKTENENNQLKISEQEAVLTAEKNKRIIFYSAGGLLSFILILVFIGYRNKAKANRIISEQKNKVENQHAELQVKNKEILDSINYARRLQEAILPPQKLVKEYLKDSFVLYKPKDIVAGDFYFMEVLNDKIIFAAADCTGHGVPGAMVSVVCSNALKQAVREFGLTKPSEILDKVKEIVVETFSKSESEVKDGMDISIITLDKNGLGKDECIIQWAGANNPLWIVRKNQAEIEEIKPDKQPVGLYFSNEKFTNHEVKLFKDDTIYIFTDGFADQFGGDKGKKLKSVNFKKYLLGIQHAELDVQREMLDESFEKWRSNFEQVDDVCIIGVKL